MKLFKLFTLVLFLSVLSGCGESTDNDDLPAFANPDAPEYRAIKFFDAIYNTKNLKTAQKYTTKKLGSMIKSYGSTRSYARYVLNLQMNPGVELKIDRSLNQVTTGRPDETTINVLFTGTLNNNTVNDVKRVVFKKIDDQWLIKKIENDPYSKK